MKSNYLCIFKVAKVKLSDKCSPTELCNELIGLSCQEGVCKCANNSYWKTDKCGIID